MFVVTCANWLPLKPCYCNGKKLIDILLTAFVVYLTSLILNLQIFTYIREQLEQTIKCCRMPMKVMFTYVGYYYDSKLAFVASKVYNMYLSTHASSEVMHCLVVRVTKGFVNQLKKITTSTQQTSYPQLN